MNRVKDFIKSYQRQIVLSLGFVLVAAIGFGLGQLTTVQEKGPEIRLETIEASNNNYTPTVSGLQSEAKCNVKATASSKIYHMPGQSGYDRLSGQVCFDTEEQAQTAGYRKALR